MSLTLVRIAPLVKERYVKKIGAVHAKMMRPAEMQKSMAWALAVKKVHVSVQKAQRAALVVVKAVVRV